MIRAVTRDDAQAICDIYNYYVENTVISFEEEAVSVDDMEQRIVSLTTQFPWIVYEEGGEVIAYAYAGKWKDRSAYRFVLESTVYAKHGLTQKGVGSQLYQALFDEVAQLPVNTIMGVIALPNNASVALHEKFGFEKVAIFKEIGFKMDQWIDVGFWQKTL